MVGNKRRTDFEDAGKLSSLEPSRTSRTSAALRISLRLRRVRQSRNEIDRKVIHAVVAQILEDLEAPKPLPEPLMPVMITDSGEGWLA